jgi:hypothetical protein
MLLHVFRDLAHALVLTANISIQMDDQCCSFSGFHGWCCSEHGSQNAYIQVHSPNSVQQECIRIWNTSILMASSDVLEKSFPWGSTCGFKLIVEMSNGYLLKSKIFVKYIWEKWTQNSDRYVSEYDTNLSIFNLRTRSRAIHLHIICALWSPRHNTAWDTSMS